MDDTPKSKKRKKKQKRPFCQVKSRGRVVVVEGVRVEEGRGGRHRNRTEIMHNDRGRGGEREIRRGRNQQL